MHVSFFELNNYAKLHSASQAITKIIRKRNMRVGITLNSPIRPMRIDKLLLDKYL